MNNTERDNFLKKILQGIPEKYQQFFRFAYFAAIKEGLPENGEYLLLVPAMEKAKERLQKEILKTPEVENFYVYPDEDKPCEFIYRIYNPFIGGYEYF